MRPFDFGLMPETERQQNDWLRFVATVAVLALFFGALARSFAVRYQMQAGQVAGVYGCFLLTWIYLAAPGVRGVRIWIKERLPRLGEWLLLLPLWCLPYFIYAAGTGDLRWEALARLFGVFALLFGVYFLLPVRDLSRLGWQDVVAALWLICAVLFHWLNGVWNVPVHLDFMARLYLISIAAWCWTFVRPVPQLGYEFSFPPKVFLAAALYFGLFAVIAIPLGFALRFVGWHPQWHGLSAFCTQYLEIFLFVALLEELFFRSFLQTLTSASLRSSHKGQGIVSCLFGLFHILHAPFPNWRYVILATIAGWCYGSAFRRGGNLMASSLTHAMVDTVWHTFLSRT